MFFSLQQVNELRQVLIEFKAKKKKKKRKKDIIYSRLDLVVDGGEPSTFTRSFVVHFRCGSTVALDLVLFHCGLSFKRHESKAKITRSPCRIILRNLIGQRFFI